MQPKHKGNYKPGTATPKVLAMGKIDFHGNIIPNTWYDKLKFESGKTDSISILILSEIVYWYRPTEIRSEKGGEYSYNKKFRSDMLQKSYKDLSSKFGFSVKQIRESFKRLEDQGLIKRVLRTLLIDDAVTPNIMFIDIFPDEIQKLTLPSNTDDYHSLKGNTPYQGEGGHSLEGNTLFTSKETPSLLQRKDNIQRVSTEITSKITEEGNPPKPACSLDSVDAFASSVIPDVSPSPHPGCADRRTEKSDTAGLTPDQGIKRTEGDLGELEQAAQSTQDLSEAEQDQQGITTITEKLTANFAPFKASSGLKQDKINAESVQEATGQSGESNSESEGSSVAFEVKTQMFDNSGVVSASARCDAKFRFLMPSMELSPTDKQWLKKEGGQRLLAAMQAIGVELTQWWEFLDYWHKVHQLWSWKGQDGFSSGTDLEKRRDIRSAFFGWSRKADNGIALADDLECFKSRLCRAQDSQRTEQHQQKKDLVPRRRRSADEIAALLATFDGSSVDV